MAHNRATFKTRGWPGEFFLNVDRLWFHIKMLYLITLATDTPVVYFTTKFHKNDEFFSRNGNDLRNIPF